MQNEIVEINQKDVVIKEFRGQRVVTFKDIDLVHERPEGTAGRNFRENKKHLIEREDYFYLAGEELRRLKQSTNFVGSNARELMLITEQGYLMLVKSFTDDLAWDVQRQLVNNYFNPHPVHNIIYQYPLPAATFESVANLGRLLDRTMRSEGACPHEVAKVLKSICNQAGIELPECFVKLPAYEQYTLDLNYSRYNSIKPLKPA